ncbi:putative ABC transport system permease protein [Williamsia muralis]|uniref:Putative ABC transport system permease protein n=1 Tax=Williamsia marianensis TaxID=85044 RepID=A0A495IU41_WILMA|nr:ABC transporter permease [Williamsia muralis]RKR79811.1 putative ABC transport system permease protein [Williamsia muralis]
MFVAWRDLRFAKGRFALMGTVIVLITMLVGLLSGLTAGLGKESTSAITELPADHLTFAAPTEGKSVSFTDSTVTESTWQQWAAVDGVQRAEPLGITTTKAEAGSRSASISAFGVQPGSTLAPESDRIDADTAILSTSAANELDAGAGDHIILGGQRLSVAAIAGDASYSHTPVIYMDLQAWQTLSGGASDGPLRATVVGLSTVSDADLTAADERIGTDTVPTADAKSAVGSYSSENGSLQLMRAFLFAISALVIGAFFTVWTIQRSGDVAVLKALGASTAYLLRDALGQAVALLTVGTAIGTGLAAAVGALVSGPVPFVLDIGTVAIPALIIIVLGAAGAGLSINRITSVDPLTALGSAR